MYGVEPPKGAAGIFNKRKVGDKPALAARGGNAGEPTATGPGGHKIAYRNGRWVDAAERFICPCHGSTYERDSKYVRGPAPRNLDQFRVKIVNGNVTVDTGQRVFGEPHT